MKTLPIGVSDFKEIIDCDSYYVDKTLLIKEILDRKMGVYLFPRPRRFGKTLNMNMLKCFFEKSHEDNSYLFKNLKIWEHEGCRNAQGKYPVIFLTFKDIKNSNWHDTLMGIQLLIKNAYASYEFLLQSEKLNSYDKQFFNTVLNGNADNAQYEASLKFLSDLLFKYHGKRVVILIDEYDMPISSGFTHGFYDDVIGFMRNFLSGALKDNTSLYFSCLTGILRVAKESIFSGLNNLYVSSTLNSQFSNHFGFTEDEVKEIAIYFQREHKLGEIKNWYNGYRFGETDIYNPWSILNYFANDNNYPLMYWINTSSNDLIAELLAKSDSFVKRDFEILINGGTLEKIIDDNISYKDIDGNESALWSFLYMSGYLKSVDTSLSLENEIVCTLTIPNLEVLSYYRKVFRNWLGISVSESSTRLMLKSLVTGAADDFEYLLNQLLIKSISYFDTNESFYHGFVLGLLVELGDTYFVTSNRESGLGRYDVMLEPKNKSDNGVIIEFKSVFRESDNDIDVAVKDALEQIEQKRYGAVLKERNIDRILKYAIVFKGKQCYVALSELS